MSLSIRLMMILFPPLVAWLVNKKLRADLAKKEYQHKYKESILGDLENKASDCSEEIIEKMANEIYTTEMQRRSSLESKANSLLTAVAVAVAVVSLVISIQQNVETNFWAKIMILLFGIAIFHFITAAVCVTRIVRVGKTYVLTKDDMEKALTTSRNDKTLRKWAFIQLEDVELNYPMMLIKSNWLSTAQAVFLRAIILLGLSFVFLSLSITNISAFSSQVFIYPSSSDPNQNNHYVPEVVVTEIGLNNRVIWTNLDNVSHTVTSSSPALKNEFGIIFDSGNLQPYQKYEFLFTNRGEFVYSCKIHPWNLGKITVQ